MDIKKYIKTYNKIYRIAQHIGVIAISIIGICYMLLGVKTLSVGDDITNLTFALGLIIMGNVCIVIAFVLSNNIRLRQLQDDIKEIKNEL